MMFLSEDMEERERQMRIKEFCEDANEMACDEYPSFRKEQLRGKDVRKIVAARTESKKAVRKVHSLVDFLEYRKELYKKLK